MAQCFSALSPEMLSHMVWFNYQSGANIHPQYADVLTSFGQVRGGRLRVPGGHRPGEPRTSEPPRPTRSCWAAVPSSPGALLANYSPTKLKTLAESVGLAMGGPDNFAVMYDAFIDEAYREVRETAPHSSAVLRPAAARGLRRRTSAARWGISWWTSPTTLSRARCAAPRSSPS